MKKIILLFILSLSFSQAILKDGSSFTNENQPYGNAVRLNIDEFKGRRVLIVCLSEVLYFAGGNTLAITYNPLTNKPYFCSQKRYLLNKSEKGLFGTKVNKTKVLEIKIRYIY